MSVQKQPSQNSNTISKGMTTPMGSTVAPQSGSNKNVSLSMQMGTINLVNVGKQGQLQVTPDKRSR